MTKHTPAPWSARRRAGERQPHIQVWEIVWAQDGSCIAEIIYGDDNASLITAAPDLLAALDALVNTIDRFDFSTGVCCCGDASEAHDMGSGHSFVDAGEYHAHNAIEMARAAIAKARGE